MICLVGLFIGMFYGIECTFVFILILFSFHFPEDLFIVVLGVLGGVSPLTYSGRKVFSVQNSLYLGEQSVVGRFSFIFYLIVSRCSFRIMQ